jgi:hypothetical protein
MMRSDPGVTCRATPAGVDVPKTSRHLALPVLSDLHALLEAGFEDKGTKDEVGVGGGAGTDEDAIEVLQLARLLELDRGRNVVRVGAVNRRLLEICQNEVIRRTKGR